MKKDREELLYKVEKLHLNVSDNMIWKTVYMKDIFMSINVVNN